MRDGTDYGAQLASPVEAHLGLRGYEKCPLRPCPIYGCELAQARHALLLASLQATRGRAMQGGPGRRVMDDLRVRWPVPDWPAPLTPLQWAIVQLIADGHTNAEIAERLGITPGNVGTQVGQILERLGLDCRAAIAHWIVRRHRLL